MPRWSVQIIGGKRTEFLGYVTASDEHKAVVVAIKLFKIPADWQTRVIVSQLSVARVRWLRRGQ